MRGTVLGGKAGGAQLMLLSNYLVQARPKRRWQLCMFQLSTMRVQEVRLGISTHYTAVAIAILTQPASCSKGMHDACIGGPSNKRVAIDESLTKVGAGSLRQHTATQKEAMLPLRSAVIRWSVHR